MNIIEKELTGNRRLLSRGLFSIAKHGFVFPTQSYNPKSKSLRTRKIDRRQGFIITIARWPDGFQLYTGTPTVTRWP